MEAIDILIDQNNYAIEKELAKLRFYYKRPLAALAQPHLRAQIEALDYLIITYDRIDRTTIAGEFIEDKKFVARRN